MKLPSPLRLPTLLASRAAPAASSLPDEVQSAFDYTPAALSGHLAGAIVVMFLYWPFVPPALLVGWLAAFALLGALRWSMVLRFRRASVGDLAAWRRWQIGWNAGALGAAVLWGLAVWLFYGRGSAIQQTGLVLIVYTFCVGAIPVLATQPRVFLAYSSLCFVPMVGRILSLGGDYNLQLAGVLVLIFGLTTLLTRNYRQALQRIIELKLRADELLTQLRMEKQAADAARLEAEVANRAKTQFLGAASHDLRQPLHAMGLFAEALRQRTHDAAVADLVNSINESVDALDGLFTELLDITRIDAGAVTVARQPVALAELFRRLRLTFEPTAFEKGLTLRFRGAGRVVHSDPLLLERILRNLLANAIRYTDDGTVLVSARRRGGRVQIGVWDTGRGIAEADQQRVFEEFYQVPGSALAPQQRKGMGLGLAIVSRLAALIEAPLALRSQPGRGSVFTLLVAPGQLAPASTAVPVESAWPDLTLEGRRILIADDDAAVRSGLEALLRAWGASLVSFASVADACAWAASAQAARPDLLIVDDRLEAGRSGVEVIDTVRRYLGDDIAAIVVTGSTMGGHEQEAQDHRFHLLFKPVVPHRLRAMIGFKLGLRAAGEASLQAG